MGKWTLSNSTKVLKHYSYFIYPFEMRYEQESYNSDSHLSILNNLLKSQIWAIDLHNPWEVEEDRIKIEYFLPFVRNYLFPTTNLGLNKIKEIKQLNYWENILTEIVKFDCIHFKVKDSVKDNLNDISLIKNNVTTHFNIEDIKLIVNKKGISLLIFKVSLKKPSIAAIQDFNFDFRSLKALHKYDRLGIMTTNSGVYTNQGFFFVTDLINYLISDLTGTENASLQLYSDMSQIEIKSYEFYPNRVYDDRLLLFSVIVADTWSKDLYENEFFKLQYVHKSSMQSEPNWDFLNKIRHYSEYYPWKGSKYGFSSEGGVFLATAEDSFNLTVAPVYNECMYLNLYYLAILQRTLLLRFSRLLADTDDLVKTSAEKKIKSIRTELLNFTNKTWFTHLTNFQQGQEIWQRWVETLELKVLFDYVKYELQEIDSFIEQAQTKRTSSLINAITMFFIPLTVISGIFGMNLKFITDAPNWLFVVGLLATYLIIIFNWGKIKH